MERLRELRVFSLEKAQGDLTNVCKYLEGGYIEDGARLFSKVPSDRSVPRGKMCKHRRCSPNSRKHWQKFPGAL